MRAGILIVSDRALKDSTYDKCSDLIKNLLKKEWSDIETVAKYVDDDIGNIRSVLNELIKEELDLILCSGGTGLTERDVTPEAVIPLLTKRATGIEMGIMNYGMQKTKFAVLSRPVAGTIGKSFIVCMPGSPKACQEVLEYLIPLIPHLVKLVTGQDTKSHPVAVNAKSIAVNECRCGDSTVSNRPRESPFEIIEVHEALERVRRACDEFKLETEVVLIKNAAGRIIASDVLAQVNVPNVRTSILDGYAFRLDPNCNITKLKVMGYTTAGTFDEKLNDINGNDYCVRVNTGSFVPEWCNYVVMVEDTKVIEITADGEEAVIEILRMPTVPSIREAGSDIAKGELICKKGTRITDGTLGCLILSALKEVVVHKTVQVVVLSTGDEVADIETAELLKPGQLFDSNRPAIISMLSKFQHVDIIDAGIHKDDDLSVDKILKQHNPDIVISSGGVSMGEKDNLKKLFEESGYEILFGRIRMKPGKPLTVAKYKRKNDAGTGLWFGLPGNPVSAVVCSYLFVCPALRSFYNEFKHQYVMAKLECSESLKCDKYRVEYMRCVVNQDDSRERTVTVPVTNQVSSNMRSFIECNALMICDNNSGILKDGDLMKCIIINSLT
ncbi:hypothetical protein MP638_000501 [Amoeboaphelidium occidentale]|nr:hypothetical protein MP638_000501 [Amoeboaphelidium occidentale]